MDSCPYLCGRCTVDVGGFMTSLSHESTTSGECAILSADELWQITGYTTPLRQLDVLHKRGFVRAYRARDGRIILERPHYLAVCRGEFAMERSANTQSAVNLSFIRRRA